MMKIGLSTIIDDHLCTPTGIFGRGFGVKDVEKTMIFRYLKSRICDTFVAKVMIILQLI